MNYLFERIAILLLLATFCLVPAHGQRKSKKDYLVTIKTDMGSMRLVLSDKAPLHKANFIKLAQNKQYDGLLFHRVIESFMIQGGDPNSRNAEAGTPLGSGSVGYRIPAEFHPDLFQKKGAVAAARDNNPEKESSGCQFYIVQGRVWPEADLDRQIARAVRKPTETQKKTYLTEGGVPHLDGN
ncbi:peptidylprolyl isomerase, partial [Aphanothece microscopica]|uniref:peptidylprolyl isomerase n=1 Tax=Aphanothece microscopica TaxID=1049561 RepID=UPI0039850A87